MNQEWNHNKVQYNHLDKNFKRLLLDLNNGEKNIIKIVLKLVDYRDCLMFHNKELLNYKKN